MRLLLRIPLASLWYRMLPNLSLLPMFAIAPHNVALSHIDYSVCESFVRNIPEERSPIWTGDSEHCSITSYGSTSISTTEGSHHCTEEVKNTEYSESGLSRSTHKVHTSENNTELITAVVEESSAGGVAGFVGASSTNTPIHTSSETETNTTTVAIESHTVELPTSLLSPEHYKNTSLSVTSSIDSDFSSLPPSEQDNMWQQPQERESSDLSLQTEHMLSPSSKMPFSFNSPIYSLPAVNDSSVHQNERPFSPKEHFGSPKIRSRSRRRCVRCGGLVYFADRKVAMGQHWHQQCFRCSTCGRFLDPERHQEHDGDPYCNMCYNKITQPRALVQPPQSPQEKNEIVSRIRDYNLYKENKVDHIKHREVSENLLYEGVIRLYWGLNKPIILSSGGPNYGRQRGFRESLYNYVSIDDEGFSKLFESSQKNNELVSKEEMQKYMELSRDDDTATRSLNDSALQALRYGPYGDSTTGDDTIEEEDRVGDDYVLVHSDGETEDDEECDSEPEMQSSPHRQRVVLRQKSDIKPQRVRQTGIRRRSASFRKVQRHKRQAEAREEKRSKFIPPYGKPTNLRVSSIQGTDEVISMLLQKYNVENPPVQFALFVIHDSGAIEVLSEKDSPLAVRLKLGPSEDVAKIYVMEKENAEKLRVSQETAEYIKFQIPELNIFLKKYNEEEERECQKIRSKFAYWKKVIEEQLQVSG